MKTKRLRCQRRQTIAFLLLSLFVTATAWAGEGGEPGITLSPHDQLQNALQQVEFSASGYQTIRGRIWLPLHDPTLSPHPNLSGQSQLTGNERQTNLRYFSKGTEVRVDHIRLRDGQAQRSETRNILLRKSLTPRLRAEIQQRAVESQLSPQAPSSEELNSLSLSWELVPKTTLHLSLTDRETDRPGSRLKVRTLQGGTARHGRKAYVGVFVGSDDLQELLGDYPSSRRDYQFLILQARKGLRLGSVEWRPHVRLENSRWTDGRAISREFRQLVGVQGALRDGFVQLEYGRESINHSYSGQGSNSVLLLTWNQRFQSDTQLRLQGAWQQNTLGRRQNTLRASLNLSHKF